MAHVEMTSAPLFLYGTLRYLPLLEAVIGRAVAGDALVAGQMTNAEVRWAAGQSFPMICLDQGNGADGLLFVGATDADIAAIDFYEGGFDYALEPVTLSDGRTAQAYIPGASVGEAGGPFDLDDWVRDWGALSVEAAGEVMSYQGQRNAEEVAAIFHSIRLRAAARLRARQARHGNGSYQGAWQVDEKKTPYSDFFKIDDYTLRFEKFDQSQTPPLRRAVFVGMDAALVLPYDPVRDRVLLVEQFRMGPFGRGDPNPWQLEPIAGHLDPGETPEQSARREAMEEAGITLGALEPVAEGYPAPGAVTDFYYLYVGIADLPDDVTGVSGMASEGENIRSHILSFDAFMTMLDDQRAGVIPLALAGYWLARHRDRLRAF